MFETFRRNTVGLHPFTLRFDDPSLEREFDAFDPDGELLKAEGK